LKKKYHRLIQQLQKAPEFYEKRLVDSDAIKSQLQSAKISRKLQKQREGDKLASKLKRLAQEKQQQLEQRLKLDSVVQEAITNTKLLSLSKLHTKRKR
jgi:hypothetical protein